MTINSSHEMLSGHSAGIIATITHQITPEIGAKHPKKENKESYINREVVYDFDITKKALRDIRKLPYNTSIQPPSYVLQDAKNSMIIKILIDC